MNDSLGDLTGEPEKLVNTDDAAPEETSDSILEKYRSKRERERVNTLVEQHPVSVVFGHI